MKKIGIFSGTFDPVHEGHVAFVRSALAESKLDKVLVMPEENPRKKTPFASFKHRLHMAKLAFKEVQNAEIVESKFETMSFESISQLIKDSQVFLLLGSDVALSIDKWQDVKMWAPKISIICATRINQEIANLQNNLNEIGFKQVMILESPRQAAASSLARADSSKLLPEIQDYANKHQLYQ